MHEQPEPQMDPIENLEATAEEFAEGTIADGAYESPLDAESRETDSGLELEPPSQETADTVNPELLPGEVLEPVGEAWAEGDVQGDFSSLEEEHLNVASDDSVPEASTEEFADEAVVDALNVSSAEPEVEDRQMDTPLEEPSEETADTVNPELLPRAQAPAALMEGYVEEAELDLEEPNVPRPDDEILVEAALFAATDLLSLRTLRELVDPALSAAKVQKLVVSINKRLLDGKHPYEVVSTAGGWRLRTRPELYPWLRGLFKETQAKRLSQAVLETLAVIAYKQPITKAEIEAVRGVSADGALKKLLEKRLVTVSGRTDTVGRPLTYGTTKEFLEYFGINKLPDDLPRLAEFEELVQSRSLLPQVAPGGVLTTREQDEE